MRTGSHALFNQDGSIMKEGALNETKFDSADLTVDENNEMCVACEVLSDYRVSSYQKR
jgi:hypothetical protein